MAQQPIRFDNGAAYERGMGVWSRLAGEVFLDWLSPEQGLRWLDVGCGSGAFSQLVSDRCAPSEIHGIDPSDAQLAFARTRPIASPATFHQGGAEALPFQADHFDAAAMALVIFFVPDPAKGVAEMARVVRPGGLVAAYAWDVEREGFPFRPLVAEMRASGFAPSLPPSPEASRIEVLQSLWGQAGLVDVKTREITVYRTYPDFDTFWNTTSASGSARATLSSLSEAELEQFKLRVRARMPQDPDGQITYDAKANAISGRVPG